MIIPPLRSPVVFAHGLLGFVVRIDYGFLDHCVEAARRDRGAHSCLQCPAVSVAVPRHVSSRPHSAAPAMQSAAPKCSEAPGLQSLFQGVSTCWLSWSERAEPRTVVAMGAKGVTVESTEVLRRS